MKQITAGTAAKALALALSVCGAAWSVPARAADVYAPSATSEWSFVAAPYAWAASVSGRSGVFGLPPQNIDMSFSDVIKNLDGVFMGTAEARKDRFSISTDIAYTKISATVGTPVGILANSISVSNTQFTGTLAAGYAIVDTSVMHLDAIAGARLWSMNTTFSMNGGVLGGTSNSDGATWVDPLVGLKFKADLTDKVYLSGWGMIGGAGVGSKLMWDVMGGLGYQFNKTASVFGGYRAMGVDYDRDGFVYDVVQSGPILGAVFRF